MDKERTRGRWVRASWLYPVNYDAWTTIAASCGDQGAGAATDSLKSAQNLSIEEVVTWMHHLVI